MEKLRSRGHSVFLTKEPTTGWLGDVVRRVAPYPGTARITALRAKIRFDDRALLRQVAANYDRLARSRRFAVLDGARSADVVSDDAISTIEKRLGRHGRT